MSQDEKYFSYTILKIFEKAEKDYLGFILRKSSGLKSQKTLITDNRPIKPETAREILVDEKEFHRRFQSLSNDAKGFFLSLYSHGRVWNLDKKHGNNTELHLKKEVHECLDQLMVFGLPSRSHADVLVIPVEYAMLPSVDFEDVDSLTLVGLMRNYPVDFIDRIANYYNVNTKLPRIIISSETYANIIDNLPETLSKLKDREKKIMEYMMSSEGITNFIDLMNQFGMNKKSYYKGRVDFKDIFVNSSYSNGDSFISLMTKGLVFCTKGRYYGSVDMAYVPDEIALHMKNMSEKQSSHSTAKKSPGKQVSKPEMKKYEVDFAAITKKVFTVLYYLESRSKKRSLDVVRKFLSMSVQELEFTISHAMAEKRLRQTSSNFFITPEGFKFIEGKNFSSKLKKRIFEEYIFTAPKKTDSIGIQLIDNFKTLFLASLYDLKSPEMIGDMIEEMTSGENYFKFIRRVMNAMLTSGTFDNYPDSLTYMKENLGSEISEWIIEMVEFLKIYGLVTLSSQEISTKTYIFPEPEFRKIFENPGKVVYDTGKKNDTKHMKVLPNNEILVEIDADFSILKTVAEFAELKSADVICTFSITKASLLAYMNRSGKLDVVQSFLKQNSSVPVPNTVERLLSDLKGRGNEVDITICQAALQVSDSTIIDGIMQIKGASEMIEKRLSPEILIIKEGVSLYKFVTDIRKKGYVVPISVEKEKKPKRYVWSGWH